MSVYLLSLSTSGQSFSKIQLGTILPKKPSWAVLDPLAQLQLEAPPLWASQSMLAIVVHVIVYLFF